MLDKLYVFYRGLRVIYTDFALITGLFAPACVLIFTWLNWYHHIAKGPTNVSVFNSLFLALIEMVVLAVFIVCVYWVVSPIVRQARKIYAEGQYTVDRERNNR